MLKRCFRQLQLSLLAALLLGAVAPQVFAQSAVFTSEVSVDQTGDDAADARAKAMKQGETEGLAQLLDKVAPDKKESFLAALDEKGAGALVKGVEVLDEKITSNRYRAQLRITYDALAVSESVDKHVTEDSNPHSAAVLVIPIYEESDSTMLWEAGNPWRDVWAQVGLEKSGGTLIVPYGDSVDARLLGKQNAANPSYADLQPLISRYGVSEVVVLKASYKAVPSPSIDVVKRQINRERNEVFNLEYQADLQENKLALLTRAARDLSEQIERMREESLSRQALGGSAAEGSLLVLTPLSTMEAWVKVRKIITEMPGVNKTEVVAVSPQQVDTLVYFRGPKDSLARALRAKNLKLEETPNYWVVSRD